VIGTMESAAGARQARSERLPTEMDAAQLNELFASCLPKLRKSARRMFRNEQDSEDALQDALLLAFRKIHQFQGRSSFATWLYSILRNTSRGYYRRATAHPTISTGLDHSSDESLAEHKDFADERPTPEESYAQKERSELFRRATQELPEKYHAAVYQFYLGGLGEEGTARALGITASALKAQLHRSRIQLSYHIRKACMSDVSVDLPRVRPFLSSRHRVRTARPRIGGDVVPSGNLQSAPN
jgi:RNA polymerase sigma-70 factor, ECF subfamily